MAKRIEDFRWFRSGNMSTGLNHNLPNSGAFVSLLRLEPGMIATCNIAIELFLKKSDLQSSDGGFQVDSRARFHTGCDPLDWWKDTELPEERDVRQELQLIPIYGLCEACYKRSGYFYYSSCRCC